MAEDQTSRLLANAPKERFPRQIEPMLARMAPLPRDEEDWGFEIKWDGVRVLGFANRGKWRMQSRRGEEITLRYPSWSRLPSSSLTGRSSSTGRLSRSTSAAVRASS